MGRTVLLAVVFATASLSGASTLNLDPGVETFTSGSGLNDGFQFGRGMVFTMESDVKISGVGLFTDIPIGLVTYNVRQITHTTGLVNSGSTLLSSVTGLIGGAGAKYYDLSFLTPVTLEGGESYHIEALYSQAAITNYYYDWNGPAVDLTWLKLLDGTQSGHTANTVAPVLQLVIPDPVPEPASVVAVGLGFAALCRRRSRRI